MGSLGFSIDLVQAPGDAAALDAMHRQMWEIVSSRIWQFTQGYSASAEIVANYLHFQESDGFAGGSWFATTAELFYSFSDAAGMCSVEMEACAHWARLAMLDRWDEVTAAAAQHGAEVALPGGPTSPQDQLRAIVTGRSRQVFFYHFTDDDHDRMGRATTTDAPADDHELHFYGIDDGPWPLSRTGDDRQRITELIIAGRCACAMCQNVRFLRELPPARQQFE